MNINNKRERAKVYQAEDGRCEFCKRPMDQKVARFRRVDPSKKDFTADNLHLVCIDCKEGRQDLLNSLQVLPEVVEEIHEKTGMPKETIPSIMQSLLTQFGVITRLQRQGRQYWLPGIGVFLVKRNGELSKVIKLYPNPELKIAEQKRTRGLTKAGQRKESVSSV
jgi:hypothetical protein